MTKKINQLREILFSLEILRACPAVSWSLAIKLSANEKPIKVIISEFEEQFAILQEKAQSATTIVDDQIRANKIEELNRDGETLFNKEWEIEFKTIPVKEFENCEINGEKEVMHHQKDGTSVVRKVLYRDSYFLLLDTVIV